MTKQILKHISLICLLIIGANSLQAQEICDNGIDDDGDGFVDLNDEEDCFCNSLIESSLIPNPSFEEMSCCPNANEMLNCAESWIQASEATSDYVHICEGYLGNTSIPAVAPLPFPDGEGGVGFRDGQSFAGPNYKEYVGACLTEPMVIGVTYRLDFFVGFQNNVVGSTSFDMAFFGSTDCNALPFGGDVFDIGCPTNVSGYVELTQQTVSGNNDWVNVVVEFEADQAYEVIVLGPSCSANTNWALDPYFYADRLALAEVNAFGVPFESVTGSVCQDNLVVTVENEPGETYQWYFEGIAIVGETNASITLDTDDPEGIYMVIITTNGECNYSKEYDLRIPPYYAPINIDICENENYIVGTDTFDMSGYYETTIEAVDACDSIVQLTLDVSSNASSFFRDTFCEGELYRFFDLELTMPGDYEYTLATVAGCDSIVQLELSTIPLSLGVNITSPIDLILGETVDIVPDFYDPRLILFSWFDENYLAFAESLVLENYQTYTSTSIYLESIDIYGCLAKDTVEVRVDKENIRLYVPNAFSPDGNGQNDFFKYYESIALATVKTFAIFDRWGAEVYREENISGGEPFLGWDGKIRGEDAAIGVYAYFIEAIFLDGSEKVYKGDVSLLR